MALIKCPECGKEISDTIKNCIHCGYKNNNFISTILIFSFLILFDIGAFYENILMGIGFSLFTLALYLTHTNFFKYKIF